MVVFQSSNQDKQVNFSYIVWVSAFNTTFILGYLLLDLVFFPSPLSKSMYSPTSKLKVHPDPTTVSHGRRNPRGGQDETATAAVLLGAINHNGLVFFLLVRLQSGLQSVSAILMAGSANIFWVFCRVMF
jgi:glucosaminylphosphatidylinositol acyltransferase